MSFEGGRTRPSLDELAEERETEAATEGGQDLSEENCSPSDAGRVDEPINLGSGSALGILNAQATLTEQNADLLSFIAKKERKCLDLREGTCDNPAFQRFEVWTDSVASRAELKRHESELSLLKNKWESIVARSFQQQQQQQSSTPRHASSQSFSTVSSASPNTSPTPRTASLHPASTHSLDLSLLSTTFDGSEILSSVASSASVGVDPRHRSAGSDPQIEIPESVKAAGNWLGGALGRVLEAAVGMPPPSEAPPELEGKRRERDGGAGGLEILREEDEENVDDNEADDLRESRRESRTSSIETESESTSGSAEKDSTAASSVQGDDAAPSAHAVKTSPLRRKPVPERSSSPHSSSSTARRLFSTSSAASAASSRGDNTFPPPRAASSLGASTSTSPSHARTRSSLASFSDSWSSLNKRWTDLTESETFKNSKRATLGLVDTFEQGLAQALGPLEPPSLSPAMSRQGSGSGSGDRERDRAHDRSPRPSPFLGPSSSSPHSPNPNGEDSRRRLTEVPISPMPGQALSSVFASWTRGKDKKDEEHEAARVDKGKAPAHDSEPNHHKNGFDWSAFQDQKGESDEDVEEWPAW